MEVLLGQIVEQKLALRRFVLHHHDVRPMIHYRLSGSKPVWRSDCRSCADRASTLLWRTCGPVRAAKASRSSSTTAPDSSSTQLLFSQSRNWRLVASRETPMICPSSPCVMGTL